jgi:phosphosulfolactate synthase (CoM biosynthesis protein A)
MGMGFYLIDIPIGQIQLNEMNKAKSKLMRALTYTVGEKANDGFTVLHDCGATMQEFASREEADAYIKHRNDEDRIFGAAQRFIGIAVSRLMKEEKITRNVARMWIRDAAEASEAEPSSREGRR